MIFTRPRTLTLLALLASPLSASAIDCSKASLADEKAICATPSLLQLDAVLNKNYSSARQQADKASLKTSLLAWLKERQQCGEETTCLGNRYISRIKTLANVDNISLIQRASMQWDFVLSVASCNADPSYPTCEGPGMLDIFARGSGKLVQRLSVENIFIELDKQGKATTNLKIMEAIGGSVAISLLFFLQQHLLPILISSLISLVIGYLLLQRELPQYALISCLGYINGFAALLLLNLMVIAIMVLSLVFCGANIVTYGQKVKIKRCSLR